MNQVDQKTYWGLGEVVMWIRTRDYERVATVGDLSETQVMVGAMFTFRNANGFALAWTIRDNEL